MQFITNGPEIPDSLLHAHEEGQVVFFCGAGISYPAGLPGYEGLVNEIYKRLGTSFNDLEETAMDNGQYDVALNLLEQRIPGQRFAVRKALAQILKPKLRRKGAKEIQMALLQLARNREGALRLVTTNFDRIFEHVIKQTKQSCCVYSAPLLPIPKNSRWNGLVHLHGLLPVSPDEGALNHLVLTSGDFGLAYLTEGWGARFVSDLLSNYVVCFVGYSIGDRVLRYIMDALDADRMMGQVTPQAYAFVPCEPGKEKVVEKDWKAKGVTPIIYKIPGGSQDHLVLRDTLRVWAETYRDGIFGKERIVVEHALTRPSASTQQDDYVGRMLWALSDDSGLPAKRFAEHNPVPSIEWLSEFSKECFQCEDLSRFGIPACPPIKCNELRFSLIDRPTPYTLAPKMAVVSRQHGSSWDMKMSQIAHWLTRHLNNPQLVLWLVKQSGELHENMVRIINEELDYLVSLEREKNKKKLDEIRANAPNSIPDARMRVLWRILLTDRVKVKRNLGITRWINSFKRDGMNTFLRMELRELLSPMIILKEHFRLRDENETLESQSSLRQLVDCELVLAADDVSIFLRDLVDEKGWQEALPTLMEDFQHLLFDALCLKREIGKAYEQKDRSYLDLPSISPHEQNYGFRNWVFLIELLRDAWCAVKKINPLRAAQTAKEWFQLPFPTFKRLAFYAASQGDLITPEDWVDWLLIDDAWWLWSVETQREVYRLFVLKGKSLSSWSQERLENAILLGPPRRMFRDDIEPDCWQEIVDHSVWRHLAKLEASGLRMGDEARNRLVDLSVAYPFLQLAANESDEFSIWMSGSWETDFEEKKEITFAPRKRSELVQWLQTTPVDNDRFYKDTWGDTCRTRFFHSIFALCDIAKKKIWPKDRWREALRVWSQEGLVLRSWHYGAPLVQEMPDDVLQEILHSVTWWLREVSETIEKHQDILLNLCKRILNLPLEAGSNIIREEKSLSEPVTDAINHPIGHVTEALLNILFKRKPNDSDCLPDDIKPIFTQLCEVRSDLFRHGRVILASRLIALFRVDRSWTERHLLPLFQWADDHEEAKAVWEGFLWSPRLYQPLLIAFKSQFLETVNYYDELGEHCRQFVAFLTYTALHAVEGYSTGDFQSAFQMLQREGLEYAAQTLAQAMEGAGEQKEEYWNNRIRPFWHNIWPKSRDLISGSIAESFARMIIAARNEFPSALETVYDWLYSIDDLHFILHLLKESGLCKQFPKDALHFLDAFDNVQSWNLQDLKECLESIVEANSVLKKDHRYERLMECVRRGAL
ncbi:anti-phage defense-associated sirtuin Dsr1 [Aminivibrio sp.]|uniref:anti-phage defense-associated sirtuin Dsr1 n=1 Tax=Aminivibrio sp. TaxID=1872489 RepID=UPI001A37CBEF|nr:anti-phage defense-associated sirtuin Dsr1 [Aminivibrio sp.]MBL3538486.1 SIR2 family protein [Aminivibrio sp.]